MSDAAYRTSKVRTGFGNEEVTGDLTKVFFKEMLGNLISVASRENRRRGGTDSQYKQDF